MTKTQEQLQQRIQITYEILSKGSVKRTSLPLILGVVTDLGKINSKTYMERDFITCTRDNFAIIMEKLAPTLNINIKDLGEIQLVFTHLMDFFPDNILKKIPVLCQKVQDMEHLKNLVLKLNINKKIEEILRDMLSGKINPKDIKDIGKFLMDKEFIFHKEEEEYGTNLLKTFIKYMEKSQSNPQEFIQLNIINIEKYLTNILNLILHNKEFQSLEATWTSIGKLLENTNENTIVKVLHVSKDDLYGDITCTYFNKTHLFKLIYDNALGTIGGQPFTTLLVDFPMTKYSNDLEFINKLSKILASAHIPAMVHVDPSMFSIKSFKDLYDIPNLKELFQSNDMAGWNSFRSQEEAPYITFVLGNHLVRNVYGQNNPIKLFSYEETIDPQDFTTLNWSGNGYLLCEKIIDSQNKYGWINNIRGMEDGKTRPLPMCTYKSINGEDLYICPTQINITDSREWELNQLGFICACHYKSSNFAIFFGGQNSSLSNNYNDEEAQANSILSTSFTQILTVSRFIHYIKCILRDYLGTVSNKDNIKYYLQRWLSNYIILNDNISQELRQRYPLRNAQIIVNEDNKIPGYYKVQIYLQPHHQLESIKAVASLVAHIKTNKNN